MPTPTASVKVNPLTGALIDPVASTFASANGFLTSGSSDAKASVVCATTTNGTLATAFENGDTVDGTTLTTGDRILIKNQSSQAENGIYTVNASGAPTRATDFDSWDEIVGAFVTVENGTANAGTQWLCNVVSGGTINTTAITFVVPKNFVDLTTTQTVTGAKIFSNPENSYGGLYLSNGAGAQIPNCELIMPTSGSVLLLNFDFAGTTVIWSPGDAEVTLPATGTLLSNTSSASSFPTLNQNTSGNAATATTLATGRTLAITGDLAWTSPSFNGSGNVTAAGTLATVNSNVGTYGSATKASVVTVNAKGLVTAASESTVTPAVSSITGLGVGVKDGVLVRNLFSTTATAAGTTTLTVTSASTQEFTGTTTQTVKMPVVTTLVAAGWSTTFINKSTDFVTLQSSGSNTITTVGSGQSVRLDCRSIAADTTAAAWDIIDITPLELVATLSGSQSLADNIEETLVFQGAVGSLAPALNGGTGVFTAPHAGTIILETCVQAICVDSYGTEFWADVYWRKNGGSANLLGADSVYLLAAGPYSGRATVSGIYPITVAAGDTIAVSAIFSDGASYGNLLAELNTALKIKYK